eukprot:7773811-Ditylum_brightwellii.AAC.1
MKVSISSQVSHKKNLVVYLAFKAIHFQVGRHNFDMSLTMTTVIKWKQNFVEGLQFGHTQSFLCCAPFDSIGTMHSNRYYSLAISIQAGSVTNDSVTVAIAITIIFAFINILTSFGTTTNVSQYKYHQEESRSELCCTKLLGLKRSCFTVLSSSKRKEVNGDSNPLLRQVKDAYDDFVTGAQYHDTSSDGVQDFYSKTDFMDWKSDEALIEVITSNFIPKICQKAGYLEDKLVKLYDTYKELAEVLDNDEST